MSIGHQARPSGMPRSAKRVERRGRRTETGSPDHRATRSTRPKAAPDLRRKLRIRGRSRPRSWVTDPHRRRCSQVIRNGSGGQLAWWFPIAILNVLEESNEQRPSFAKTMLVQQVNGNPILNSGHRFRRAPIDQVNLDFAESSKLVDHRSIGDFDRAFDLHSARRTNLPR